MALPARITKPRREQRIRCPSHLKWVRGFECCVDGCQERPIEAAHVRLGSHAGIGQKPDDTKAISLCSSHHAESHNIGEASFAVKYKLDLHLLADLFAAKSPHRHRWMKP